MALRSFTFGHIRQLNKAIATATALARAAGAGPGDGEAVVIDLDSTIALDRVQVDRAASRDRVVVGFEDDLAGETAGRCPVSGRSHHHTSPRAGSSLATSRCPTEGGEVTTFVDLVEV